MFAVHVMLEAVPGCGADLAALAVAQAQASLSAETDCRVFEVWSDASAPDRLMLWEIYESKAAFDAHLKTPHFDRFNAAAAPLTARKIVTAMGTRLDPQGTSR